VIPLRFRITNAFVSVVAAFVVIFSGTLWNPGGKRLRARRKKLAAAREARLLVAKNDGSPIGTPENL